MKTEKNNFDSLTAEQVGKLFPIDIIPYNAYWEKLFKQEETLITKVLYENMVNIEHFGSTSVAGLAAKPTIDILVEVADLNDEIKLNITQKLETIGYGNMYHAEKEKKMTFGKGYEMNHICSQTYHVHIREKGNMPQDEIFFRDYLRKNSNARDEYAELKYKLSKKYRFNREDYTQAKTEFIQKITEQEKQKNQAAC